jgi:serine/threonine protein kinase
MGEMYRARHTKLDRDVAIKVLPSALSGDPERLALFGREAKVLAGRSEDHRTGFRREQSARSLCTKRLTL